MPCAAAVVVLTHTHKVNSTNSMQIYKTVTQSIICKSHLETFLADFVLLFSKNGG